MELFLGGTSKLNLIKMKVYSGTESGKQQVLQTRVNYSFFIETRKCNINMLLED